MLAGIYRGFVESVDDTESRYRYRVRVAQAHPSDVPVEHLPWAESVVFGGKDFGDVPHYEVGDKVFVMFEQGHRDFPVVVGGWMAAPDDTPDFPPDQSEAYADRRKKWERIDRDGNRVVMVEGAADDADSIIIEAKKRLRVIVGKSMNGEFHEDVTVVIDRDCSIHVQGDADIEVDGTTTIAAHDTVTVDADGDVNLDVGGETTINATGDVNLNAQSDVNATVSGNVVADVTGDVAVNAQGDVDVATPGTVTVNGATEVDVQSAAKVKVEAPLVELGAGALQAVVQETKLLTFFNTHIHPDPASGNTGVPVVPLTPGVVASGQVAAGG